MDKAFVLATMLLFGTVGYFLAGLFGVLIVVVAVGFLNMKTLMS